MPWQSLIDMPGYESKSFTISMFFKVIAFSSAVVLNINLETKF